MKTFIYARAVQAALVAAAIGGVSTAALANIKDYKFELADQTVQAGPDKVITVRLMNTKPGKPVPDAVKAGEVRRSLRRGRRRLRLRCPRRSRESRWGFRAFRFQ